MPKRKAAALAEPQQPPAAPDQSAVASDGKVSKQPAVIVVLERACLETGLVGKDHVLLNADDHNRFLHKHKRDPADYRPDILHQSMLILLDSPLNKARPARAAPARHAPRTRTLAPSCRRGCCGCSCAQRRACSSR
jgi:hypothetical protein